MIIFVHLLSKINAYTLISVNQSKNEKNEKNSITIFYFSAYEWSFIGSTSRFH